MRTPAGALMALLGLAALPAVFWAHFHLLFVIADAAAGWRAAAYKPAVFDVEWARLDEGSPVAVGTIGGRREVLSLSEILPRRTTGLNDLQDMMAGKDRIEVLYDARGTRTAFEGRLLRVLPRTTDLRADRLGRAVRTFAIGYGPVLLLVGLGFLVSRLTRQSMGCWFAPALFFLALQPVFAVVVIATELFP